MTLPYDEHCGSDSDLFRSLYMLQLKRVKLTPTSN